MFDSIIAKEGRKAIFYAFIAFLVFVILECGFLTFISFVIMAFLIYAFRLKYIDVRTIKDEEIVAPISGTISSIDTQDFVKTVYIDVSLCDYHILRSLESGECKTTINRGLNLSLGSFKAKQLNENATFEYENSKMQIYSSMCNASLDIEDKVPSTKGEKIGVFLHGQVVVTLNKNFETSVKIGEKVVSGETLLAKSKTK